jgi:hypothetical protein
MFIGTWMKKNIGSIDRLIRAVAGVVIIGLGLMFQSWWGAVGAVPLFTALVGWCPPYAMLGFSTCKITEEQA